MRGALQFVVAIGVLLLSHTVSAADNAKLKTELSAMLNEGWLLGPDGLSAAVSHHSEASRAAPGDVRVLYAWAIINIRQRRYPDATKALEDVLSAKPDHWGSRRAKIWLEMVARKHDAALADAEDLADLWPQPTLAADLEELDETSRFLGKLFGFYWGALAQKVDQRELEAIETKLAAKFNATQQATFDEARGSVLGKFTDITDKADTTRQQTKLDEEKQKEADRLRLAAEKGTVEREKQSLEEQAAEIRKLAEAKIRELASAKQLLDREFDRLAAQGAALQVEIAGLAGQEALLIAEANNSDSDFESRRLLNRASSLARVRIQLEVTYAALDTQARGVNNRRSQNLDAQQQVTAGFQGEMRRLGFKDETLKRTERRITGEFKKATEKATGNTAVVRNLSNSAVSFVTYYDFPVDREKRRLLGSF